MSLVSIGRKARSIFGSNPGVYVIRDVISPKQEKALLDELTPLLRRRRYQRDHWDQVIVGYKEVERPLWHDPNNEEVVLKVREHIETALSQYRKDNNLNDGITEPEKHDLEWLPVHVIDLEESGFISPHVDSVKFSGGLVCGVSLLSPSIMTLRPPVNEYRKDQDDEIQKPPSPQKCIDSPSSTLLEEISGSSSDSPLGAASSAEYFEEAIHMYLPPRSLYILSGAARYDLAHSVDIRSSEDIKKAFKCPKVNHIDSGDDSYHNVEHNSMTSGCTGNDRQGKYHDDLAKLDKEFVDVIETEKFERSRRISLIFRDAKMA